MFNFFIKKNTTFTWFYFENLELAFLFISFLVPFHFVDVRYLEAEANNKMHRDIVGLLVNSECLKVRALV